MKLHHMIELVESAEIKDDMRTPIEIDTYKNKRLPQIMREWVDVPTFEFGSTTDVKAGVGQDLLDYANELGRNGLFTLPYEKIIISFGVADVAGITILAEEKPAFEGSKIYFSIFSAFISHRALAAHCNVIVWSNSDGLRMKPKECMLGRSARRDMINEIAEEMQVKIPTWAMGFLTLLNAKGVEQRVTPAPEKLNKRRVAAGKPPIGEIREVLINVDGRRYMPSGEAEKGSHASPRLHWRRGHIRRLPSGEITHVRPCLVGSGVSAPVPTYRVKQSA